MRGAGYRQVVNTKYIFRLAGHPPRRMPSQTFDTNLIRVWSKCVGDSPQHSLTTSGSGDSSIEPKAEVMEFLSASWWSALLAIILIDLVLAGDNAIVIALAARNLPRRLQTKAIIWGTVGAIIVRCAMTVGALWLLQVPGLMLAGGIALLWIAYRLLASTDTDAAHGPAAATFWAAMKTIVIADALMGIDNVLGVAGAANGEFALVVIGLLISVPIVVFGSTVVLRLVHRFPVIIHAGAAVLAFTAAKMIVDEPLLQEVFDHAALRWGTYAVAVAGVLATAAWTRRRSGVQRHR
jgi:YjbE family integral membrane protein